MPLEPPGRDPNITTEELGTGDTTGEELMLLVSSARGAFVLPLERGRTYVLGRADGVDIPLDDAAISREHARLTVAATITLEDLGSHNGTMADGVRIQGSPAPIEIGRPFAIGKTTFYVHGAGARPREPKVTSVARSSGPPSDGPIVLDPAMTRIYGMLDLVAPTPVSVLILGETGVGKEVLAEEIHRRSTRPRGPLLQLNCAALPESILEGELFGFEKGAFTGAANAKAGLLESADGGTVFLDEVGDMPLAAQGRLLRVLERGEVLRLGSVKPKAIDVRFVSATNRDLRADIVAGRFRADLYYRLDGIRMTIPPLRERKVEIRPLAESFMARLALKLGRSPPALSADARKLFEQYAWPGNVRELRNVAERVVVLCTGARVERSHALDAEPLLAAAAPEASTSGAPGANQGSLRTAMEAVERQRVIAALADANGNQTRAAGLLGLSRHALIKRMEWYGLDRPRKRS